MLPSLVLALALGRADAADRFQVEDIRVEGLQRVPVGTVLNYLPIRVGETIDDDRVAEAIRALYRTGFFQDVALSRDGGVLVVEVVERPSIGKIDLRGNKAIQTEDLTKALEGVGLAEGRVFNRFLLNDVERELRNIYQSRGQYDTAIESTVTPLPRNRVAVRIDIRESEPAKILNINFVGNQRFSNSQLESVFELGPRSWYHFFSDRDEYAREKLAADLERLRSFYQDQGYINFTITSTQVSVSPDRRGIYITVNLSEGEQYRIERFALAGDLIVSEEELRGLISTAPGSLYSRERVTESIRRIRERLGEEGYAFANVNAVPELDDEKHTVALTYYVDPGKRVYVRRININGNARTRDEVIRRELRQPEGAALSTVAVQRSRYRLQRLGFFEDVTIDTPAVPGEPDLVDVNVAVRERLSGSLQAGIGYGESQGVIISLSVQQDNVLGSGDRVGLELNNSSVSRVYSLSYLDRYYTPSGISRSWTISHRETDAAEANLAEYDTKTFTLGMTYGIPISEEDTLYAGASAEYLGLDLDVYAPQRLHDFVRDHGDEFTNFKLNLSWQRDSRDTAIFARRGARQTAGLELAVPGSDLQVYRLTYSYRHYFPLTEKLTLSVHGSLGYGDGYGNTEALPFFENFYAGGISTIRGFRSNSLGPRDPIERLDLDGDPSTLETRGGDPTGGNARIIGNIEVLFPMPYVEVESMRMFVFLDGGNVFDTRHQDISVDEFRYSTGVGLTWLSPLGALTISLARPLNDRAGDQTEFFQFSLGSFF